MNNGGFFQQLKEKIEYSKNRLCIGIDPHLDQVANQFFLEEIQKNGVDGFTSLFCRALIDAAAAKIPAVKFQSAFFEAMGAKGFEVLRSCIAYAQSKGLLVIFDAKRGDISSTMKAYGAAAFETFKADCLTIIPYMGSDVVAPLVPWLKKGKGVYSVALSSNVSGRTAQNTALISETDQINHSDPITIASHFAHILSSYLRSVEMTPQECLGFVVGAGYFTESPTNSFLSEFTEYSFLIPGFGAQESKLQDIESKSLNRNAHLIPMSRCLAGLGLKNDTLLEAVRSWDSYGEYVQCRIEEHLSLL